MVRVIVPQSEGWEFETLSLQTLVAKTGSDSSIAKCSALGVRVMGDDHYKRMPRVTVGVAH